jgi:hypothetical protein
MSKELGLISEMRFQLAATLKGFTVSKPQGDYSPYDFVLDTGKRLVRVQVKSSSYIDNQGRFHFNLKSGATQSRAYTALEVHFFALYVVSLDLFYIIPQALLNGRKTIKITPNGKFDDFKNAWDFSPGKIRYERNEGSTRRAE